MATANMEKFIELYKKSFGLVARNIVDIGTRDGDDAAFLASAFSVPDNKIFLVECHPKHVENTKKNYPNFKLFPVAISDKVGMVKFDAIGTTDPGLDGASSLRERTTTFNFPGAGKNWVEVESITGAMLYKKMGEEILDIVKVDTEGMTYEVLKSFGNELKNIKALHAEAETVEIWKGQRTYGEVYTLLLENGFREVFMDYVYGLPQCDTFWVNTKFE